MPSAVEQTKRQVSRSRRISWICSWVALSSRIHRPCGHRPYGAPHGGLEQLLVESASKNSVVVGAVADVSVLKTEFKQIQSTADTHTVQLQFLASDQQRNAALQGKIFDALKSLGADLQNVDKHLSAVDAHVSDQADQIRELRSERNNRLCPPKTKQIGGRLRGSPSPPPTKSRLIAFNVKLRSTPSALKMPKRRGMWPLA